MLQSQPRSQFGQHHAARGESFPRCLRRSSLLRALVPAAVVRTLSAALTDLHVVKCNSKRVEAAVKELNRLAIEIDCASQTRGVASCERRAESPSGLGL